MFAYEQIVHIWGSVPVELDLFTDGNDNAQSNELNFQQLIATVY